MPERNSFFVPSTSTSNTIAKRVPGGWRGGRIAPYSTILGACGSKMRVNASPFGPFTRRSTFALAVTKVARVIVTLTGAAAPLVPSKIPLSRRLSPTCGTVSWVPPASRSSRSREPKESRAASVPQSMRMRTSS